MQGAFSRAWRKRSRTREAPTPTNISTKSEPEIEKNGTPASPATAFASSVLPVPGGPTNNTPLGILPPKAVYFFGFFKKSTTSTTSSLASSSPATSAKVILTLLFWSKRVALDLPILKIWPPGPPAPPPTLRMINTHTATIRTIGRIQVSSKGKILVRVPKEGRIKSSGSIPAISCCFSMKSLNIFTSPISR